jgi:hypothetical protein
MAHRASLGVRRVLLTEGGGLPKRDHPSPNLDVSTSVERSLRESSGAFRGGLPSHSP